MEIGVGSVEKMGMRIEVSHASAAPVLDAAIRGEARILDLLSGRSAVPPKDAIADVTTARQEREAKVPGNGVVQQRAAAFLQASRLPPAVVNDDVIPN